VFSITKKLFIKIFFATELLFALFLVLTGRVKADVSKPE
jgi:hypothetical protein